MRLQNGSCVTSHHQRVERFTRLPLHSFERTLHIRWGIGNQCVTNPKIYFLFSIPIFFETDTDTIFAISKNFKADTDI